MELLIIAIIIILGFFAWILKLFVNPPGNVPASHLVFPTEPKSPDEYTEDDMSPMIELLMYDDYMEDGDLDIF